ncbi:hypothetical protein ACQRSF_003990, partial [Pseudomonas aeruginosa]
NLFQLVATLGSLKKPPSGGFFVPVCWESGLEAGFAPKWCVFGQGGKKSGQNPPGARSRPPATPPL